MSRVMEMRETRECAFETKFLVSPALGQSIREWARARLSPDPHATGMHGDEYRTTSLYFDTEDFDVFRRQRSYRRSKYRIRRYGDADMVFLERKLRTSVLLSKRRTSIAMPDLACLSVSDTTLRWPGRWFQQRLVARRLHPVCQVAYHRTARVGTTDHGPIRLTLDDHVSVLPAADLCFAIGAGASVLERGFVLELKYRFTMPTVFKQLVEEFALNPKRVSKYRLGVSALIDQMTSGSSELRQASTIELLYA